MEPEITEPPKKERAGFVRAKKIVFLGLFGQQNLGNDCSLHAMIEHTRNWLPDAEMKCICTGPEEIRTRYGIPAFQMYAASCEIEPGKKKFPMRILTGIAAWAWRELLHGVRASKFLKGNDMLIVPGTGLLVDHTTGFRGYPYYLFKWSLIARLRGCKLLFVSMGAGPIYHPLSRWFIRFALSSATYRSYRDAFSKQYIESIGFKASCDPVYPDLAFSLPETMMPASNNPRGPRPVIGVGVVDYCGPGGKQQNRGQEVYRDYINKSATFVAWLHDHHYPVRMLIGDIKYDSRVRQDVIELLEKRGLIDCEGRIINEGILSLSDLLAQLEKIDIVISPRFHNIILALMLNKPVIVLSHDDKFDSLMAELGLAEYCLAIDGLDVDRLIERFTEVEKNGEALKTYIKDKSEEYRRVLDQQYSIIFKDVLRN
jgi:polysaccharide pyruvyl transferase WcaK-like protein